MPLISTTRYFIFNLIQMAFINYMWLKVLAFNPSSFSWPVQFFPAGSVIRELGRFFLLFFNFF
jgi:hypothetical protein